jgi:menaquinone-dependent protoporphyrinogen oxidase
MSDRPRALVIYASTHGQTAKIAARLAESLTAGSTMATLVDVAQDPGADPSGYDGVVVAASIHRGQHQEGMSSWVRENRDQLAARPNAFLSVSLTAADDGPEAVEATQGCIDEFVEATGWKPDRALPIAGALQYREYDPFTRILMRLLMKRGGHPTDTSHDHDYTDWEALDRLGRELAADFSAAHAREGV